MSQLRRSACGTALRVSAWLALALLRPWPAPAAQFSNPERGYSFTYQDDWTVDTAGLSETGGPVLRNFAKSDYLHGGGVPFGGAYIGIAVFPPYPKWWPPDTDEYAWLKSSALRSGGHNITMSNRLSNAPARVDFTAGSLAGPRDKCVSVIVRKGGRVFKFFLEYQALDTAGPEYERVLTDVIASVSVIGPMPPVTPFMPSTAP